MLIYVEIGYCYGEAWDNADWPKIRENYPKELPEEKPKSAPFGFSEDPIRLTIDEAQALSEAGLKIGIKPPPGAMVVKMRDNGAQPWEAGTRIKPVDVVEGTAVQIAVPDMALMYIDKVKVEEDCCTDQLQDMLDEGWRILAVCPPNSARRPDYILGRRDNKDPFDVR